MNTRHILLGLLGAAAFAFPIRAEAQYGVYGWPCGAPSWGTACSYYPSPSLPYFALYPPVYYSHHVARAYGLSPFADPPAALTGTCQRYRHAAAEDFSMSDESDVSGEPRGLQPLRIDNPYIDDVDRPGVAAHRAPVGRQPQIVHPTQTALHKSG